MTERTLLVLGFAAMTAALVEFAMPGRRRFALRFALQAVSLAVLSAALVRLVGSPVTPRFDGSTAVRATEQLLASAWWAMAARMAVIASRLLLTRETRPRESRILLDLLAGVVYVGAAVGVVAFVLGIPVRGLLATSGVIAIVLGLALQSTLGDLFSGIAVGVERPYRAGDQLSVDGGVSGRVVEVNWRSTHIRAGHDIVVVPNSLVAKARLVNRSAPTLLSGETLEVRVHPAVPPPLVLGVLRAALLSCETLASDVAANALLTGLAGDGSTYTLSFATNSVEQAGPVRSEVLSQVQRHLFHAGIPLAITGAPPAAGWQMRLPSAEELLLRSDLFAGVSEPNRALLALRLRPVELQAGDVLFREGAPPDAMFLIASGTVEVRRSASERRFLLAPGESLGQVALFTGEPYRTTATALNAVRLFRLDGEDLATALAEAPELGGELEDAVRRALAAMARFDAGEDAVETEGHGALLRRFRVFLRAIR